MTAKVKCRRPECERLHDPTANHVGAPDYCSGLCRSKDSERARAAAAARAARAARAADVSRANLELARAALAAHRKAATAGSVADEVGRVAGGGPPDVAETVAMEECVSPGIET